MEFFKLEERYEGDPFKVDVIRPRFAAEPLLPRQPLANLIRPGEIVQDIHDLERLAADRSRERTPEQVQAEQSLLPILDQLAAKLDE